MYSKWVDEPAFETNKFKAGDRVRFYDGNTSHEEVVEEVDGDFLRMLDGAYHFKQCRLLKEPKKVKRWVSLYKDDTYTICRNAYRMVGAIATVEVEFNEEDVE